MFQEQCVVNKEKISFFTARCKQDIKLNHRGGKKQWEVLINSFIEQIFFQIHALSNTVLFS